MTEMIYTHNLSKQFGDNLAVDQLSLSIQSGEIFGLLGPNGAGKTTTIRMLTALISPSSGTARILGYTIGDGNDDHHIRRSVGILTESPGLYAGLSAQNNLAFFAKLYEVENIEAQIKRYLSMLGLWNRRHETVAKFSKGMRQKLAIARSLLHEPEVLYLDEPTSGLDPETALLVRDFIAELRQGGRAIIICTHNLDEADRLCDRVGILNTQLLALDTPSALRKQLYGRAVVFHLAQVDKKFATLLRKNKYVDAVELSENKLVVTLDDPETHNPALIRQLVRAGAHIQFVGELKRTLEDVYLHLMHNNQEIKIEGGDSE